jgi:CHAD domain-containing protein
MATVSSLAGAQPSKDERRALSYSMDRVLEELNNLRQAARNSGGNEDAVHDLRVSIRRCRSIASVLEEVDPNQAWPEMRRAAKKLFHGLGALRDAQVLKNWVQKLAPTDDPIAANLLSNFAERAPGLQDDALRAIRKFDEKNWKDLERTLRRRSRVVPPGSRAAECLALESFARAKEMHSRALRSDKSKPWHTLRKAVKQFRYTVENLLPEQHAAWRADLKRVQDLLGDIHDLDALAECVEDAIVEYADTARTTWHDTLARERAERVTDYRKLTLGNTSLWNAWRHALPHGEQLQAASMARLRATARASDPDYRRTMRTARIGRSLFAALCRAKAGSVFLDADARQLFTAAVNLQHVRADRSHKSSPTKTHKAAHKFLRGLTAPPGLTGRDWSILLATIRYHRGAEPREKAMAFGKLPADEQDTVRALAGTLRLARALRKSGVEPPSRFRAENTAETIILRIPGLPDSIDTATRLAAAKHLLEVYVAKPIVLVSVAKPQQIPPAAGTPSPQPELIHFAVASD